MVIWLSSLFTRRAFIYTSSHQAEHTTHETLPPPLSTPSFFPLLSRSVLPRQQHLIGWVAVTSRLIETNSCSKEGTEEVERAVAKEWK